MAPACARTCVPRRSGIRLVNNTSGFSSLNGCFIFARPTLLHPQGLASSDHTTLLLNCYAKLRDTTKLDQFLRAEGPGGMPALNFDVDTAIKARLVAFIRV